MNGSQVIDRLAGQHLVLSNLDRTPFEHGGRLAHSAEHHFQAAKATTPQDRDLVYSAATPVDAHRTGQLVTLVDDWRGTGRYATMRSVLEAKFSVPELRTVLVETGDALLIEGNLHHDQHWGDCVCDQHRESVGANWLGRSLMRLRRDLAGGPTRYPRIAFTGHRPADLSRADQTWIRTELRRVLGRLGTEYDTQVVISGMALGVDQWAAEAALEAGMNLWSYVPFEQQADRWRGGDVERWRELRSAASREVVLGGKFGVWILHERNRLMIRDADLLIAVHRQERTSGGTWNAILDARRMGSSILRLNITDRTTTFYPARPWPGETPPPALKA